MGAGDLVDRQELAGDLRDCVAPGQTVVWRSDPATIKLWQFCLYWATTILIAVFGLAIWLRPLGGFDWPYRYGWLSGALFALAVCFLILAFKSGTAIVLTETDIFVRSSFPGSAILQFKRSDIAEATVFAGDGTVHFHAANGDRTRLRFGGKARDFVEALSIPARVWVAHEGLKVRGITVVLVAITGVVLQQSFGFAYDLVFGETSIFMLYLILIFAVAAPVLHVLNHAYMAWKMDDDERRRAACMLLDPRWRGCDPYSSGSIPLWQVPKATLKLWLVRAFYGTPTDCTTGLEPEIIDPRHTAAAE